MKTTLICTIGPSCEKKKDLLNLKNAGVNIFRINLSHASLEDICKYHEIAKEINIDIAIDTEGAQLRTKNYEAKEILLRKGDKFNMQRSGCLSSISPINITPKNIINQLTIGDLIRLDFNGAIAKITSSDLENVKCEIISTGKVGHNKGADCLHKKLEFSDFTDKDIEALKIANSLGINKVFISFCQSKNPIKYARKIVNNAWICSKIESKISIHNLPEIAEYSDTLLIDRGDLSREVSILDIPFSQRGIIKVAKEYQTPCYLATNVLESLIDGDLPTRAELSDIVSSLEMGCSGIVLAAETAIGKKPVLCAEIVRELVHKFYLSKAGLLHSDLDRGEITDHEMNVWINRNSMMGNI